MEKTIDKFVIMTKDKRERPRLKRLVPLKNRTINRVASPLIRELET